jgi:hypothetical protein
MELIQSLYQQYLVNYDSIISISKTLFYSWYGFVSCILLVILAKAVGFIVKRDENYYEGNSIDR